jgi:hypothetical protein
MNDIKALGNNELINRLVEKNKKMANEAANKISKGKRV